MLWRLDHRGNIPGLGTRYPQNLRWTGILASALEDDFEIIEAGLNGRTTVFDDPYRNFCNGKKGWGYSLSTNRSIDLVILNLDTNDLKFTDAIGSYKRIEELLHYLTAAEVLCRGPSSCKVFPPPNGMKVLVISPITLHKEIAVRRPDSGAFDKFEESLKLAFYYKAAADRFDAFLLDAVQFAVPSGTDCVHMDSDSHERLDRAVAAKVMEIF